MATMPRDPHAWNDQQINAELNPFTQGWLQQQNITLENGNYCLNERQMQQFTAAIFKQCGTQYDQSLGGSGTQLQREQVREDADVGSHQKEG